jgi:hypothetical protein
MPAAVIGGGMFRRMECGSRLSIVAGSGPTSV